MELPDNDSLRPPPPRGYSRRERELDALAGLGAVLGILESAFIPAGFPVRLGLGNAVVVLAARRHGTGAALRVGVVRNILVAFARATILTPTILFGMVSAVSSALVMGVVYFLSRGDVRDESVGALGATVSNLAQVAVYCALSGGWDYYPALAGFGTLWGIGIGAFVGHAAGRIHIAWEKVRTEIDAEEGALA